jgi:hypothetical protein
MLIGGGGGGLGGKGVYFQAFLTFGFVHVGYDCMLSYVSFVKTLWFI